MMRRILLAIFTFSLTVMSGASYQFRHIDTTDGLPSNKITAIKRDHAGFLWLGISGAVCRFDGLNHKTYYLTDSLTNLGGEPDVMAIEEDYDGRLWLRAHRNYFIYEPHADSIIPAAPVLERAGIPLSITALITLSDGTLAAADPATGVYIKGRHDTKARLIDTRRTRRMTGEEVVGMVEMPDAIALILHDGTLVTVDPAERAVRSIDTHIPDQPGARPRSDYSLFVDGDSVLWVYNYERLWALDLKSGRWQENLIDQRNRHGINSINLDSQGRLWVSRNHNGLEQVLKHPDRYEFVPVANEGTLPQHFTVNAINEDIDGTIWLGTYKRGLFGFNPAGRLFDLVEMPDVNCLLPLPDGRVGVGTDGSGVLLWDPAKQSVEQLVYASDPGEKVAVTSLYAQPDGTLYVGTFSRGLRSYRGGRYDKLVTGSGLDRHYVWTMSPSGDGRIWIGTLGGGLFLFNPATGEVDSSFDSAGSPLTTDYLISSTAAADGKVYLGTADGCFVIDRPSGSPRQIVDIPHANLTDIHIDRRGLLWMATIRGLLVYDTRTGSISSVNFPGIPESGEASVLGVGEDAEGGIWATVGSRLVGIKAERDAASGHITVKARGFDRLDGLQNGDFNQRSFCLLPDSTLLVGGLNGISRIKPSELVSNQRAPRVLFSDLIVGNRPVRVGEKLGGRRVLAESLQTGRSIELPHSENEFSILLASDNFILPEKTVFSYCLEGMRGGWRTTDPGENRITFSNLPAGSYRLLVKAFNSDGVESPEVASLDIVVHPPFYLTIWAKLIYLLCALAVIYLAYRYIKLRERRKFDEKRKADALKRQEELNKAKFNFFTNVSHELRTPITLILAPLEAMLKDHPNSPEQGRLVLMRNNARRLLNQVNQLLDFRKHEEAGLVLNLTDGDLVGYVGDVCRSFIVFSERKDLKIKFSSDLPALPMRFDADKIYKVVMNLLGNAIKFTPEGGEVTVTVGLSEDGRRALIRVADTGPGIPDEEKAKVFERFYQVESADGASRSKGSGIGLSLVREYVDLHGGDVSVSDAEPTGCIMTISIPVVPCESAVAELPAPSTGNERPVVLVVDDNAEMRDFIKDCLRKDYHVITAPDALSALSIMQGVKPSAVITDLMMEGMDGLELVRRIRTTPSLSRIPVLMLTAKEADETKVEALMAGADDCMTKPFDLGLLTLRVGRLIAGAKQGNGRIDPEPETISITPLDEKLVEKAVKYVMANVYRPDLSVEELSSHLGMSRVHLYKRLKFITGKTPVEFIRTLRLKRGAQLLRESQLNVSEVAYKVGYNSPKYFSKYFKEEYGMIPSAYQEAERRGLDTSVGAAGK